MLERPDPLPYEKYCDNERCDGEEDIFVIPIQSYKDMACKRYDFPRCNLMMLDEEWYYEEGILGIYVLSMLHEKYFPHVSKILV